MALKFVPTDELRLCLQAPGVRRASSNARYRRARAPGADEVGISQGYGVCSHEHFRRFKRCSRGRGREPVTKGFEDEKHLHFSAVFYVKKQDPLLTESSS